MASRRKAMATAVRLGVKYGPMAYEAVKHGREPAQAAAIRAYDRLSARRQALAHAAVVVDGSVAKTFAGDQQVWVVLSGDEPIASHPATDVPFAELLRHADPTKRIRPEDVGRAGRRRRSAKSADAHSDATSPGTGSEVAAAAGAPGEAGSDPEAETATATPVRSSTEEA